MEPILTANSYGATLELYDYKIVIKRHGASAFILHGMKGDKEIQISNISAIQIKKVGTFTAGYIQFSFLGGQETKKALLDATKDENTIMFKNSSQQEQFISIKEAIEKRMDAIRRGNATPNISGLDELEKLADLQKKGIITEEEFVAKKKQILGI